MSRVAIDVTVQDPAGNAKAGASVAVKRRADNTPATWYTAETGGTSSTASLATDANGRVSGWVERGAYTLNISGSGITSVSYPWEAGPAGDGTIDGAWLGNVLQPVGIMSAWAGTGDPAGGSWLLCDGRLLSRTAYPALFAAIGATYGAGDGSTTFAIPDTRGRAVFGADLGQGRLQLSGNRGAAGGAETVTLTTAQLPSHAHGGSTSNSVQNLDHDHRLWANNTGPFAPGSGRGITGFGTGTLAGGTESNDQGKAGRTETMVAGGYNITNHYHAVNAEGGGGAHYNTPPQLTVGGFIIRAK